MLVTRRDNSLEVRIPAEVSGYVDVDLDDVLRELTDDDIASALERRHRRQHGKGVSKLTLIYEEFVRRGDAPEVLRDYIYDLTGRILP